MAPAEVSIPLAVLVVVTCVALALAADRALRRRTRREWRRRLVFLQSTVEAFFSGRVALRELRHAVADADETTFWTVLETAAMRRPGEWRRLAAALERSSHARAERRALRDESPWRRVLAARRLALLPSPASRRALRRALVRGPELVVDAAARALARDGDRAALRWILKHPGSLAHRSHPALVALLGRFGAGATRDLMAALAGDPDPRFERAAIEVLGLREHRPARAAIEQRLAAPELELRVAAARALGRLRAVESTSELLVALVDGAWQVRAQSARALGRVRAPAAVDALAERLSDSSWWVRHHAATALAELGEPGRAALAEVAETSRDPYARDIARETLNLSAGSRSA